MILLVLWICKCLWYVNILNKILLYSSLAMMVLCFFHIDFTYCCLPFTPYNHSQTFQLNSSLGTISLVIPVVWYHRGIANLVYARGTFYYVVSQAVNYTHWCMTHRLQPRLYAQSNCSLTTRWAISVLCVFSVRWTILYTCLHSIT
jgi:hypothetical protein